jgi:hypothetical protein
LFDRAELEFTTQRLLLNERCTIDVEMVVWEESSTVNSEQFLLCIVQLAAESCQVFPPSPLLSSQLQYCSTFRMAANENVSLDHINEERRERWEPGVCSARSLKLRKNTRR